ncbi:hypothetical protein AYO46_07490 [Betaproteobacteria bacterium SCGC AG-212-J23]|nr:hypothetical protein AYO46_07490 [Betaproteobacteria bacterium SCGC AG-212-J23]
MEEKERVPEMFGHLITFAFHAADRAWTGLLSFLTAQSVLVLAWATVLTAKEELAARGPVMLTLSLIGALFGFQWCLLGTRMWHYHLEYVNQIRLVADGIDGVGARGFGIADTEVKGVWHKKHWLFEKAANTWTLFLAPLFISFLHLVMWIVAAVAITDWPTPAWWPRALLVAVGIAGFVWTTFKVWKICEPVLTKKYPPWRIA